MSADLDLMTPSDLPPEPKGRNRPWGFAEDLGRYWLPDPADPAAWEPGAIGARHLPRGVMRTSNLINAYEDTRALSIWEQKKIVRGFAERQDLYAELITADRDDNGDVVGASRLIDAALRQAKADEASIIGTAYHRVLEVFLRTGEWIGTQEMQDAVRALLRLLADCFLKPAAEYAERIVYNSHLKVAGRFDVPVLDYSAPGAVTIRMADLKTKRKAFTSVLAQRAQLAVYARADAMWDEAQQCYITPPPFDLEEGVLLHIPQPGEYADAIGGVQLLRMDLRKGWETALLCRQIVDSRAESRSEPMLRGLRMEPPAYTEAHHWRTRLRLCTSLAEGSEVLAAAKAAMPHEAESFDALAAEVAKEILSR